MTEIETTGLPLAVQLEGLLFVAAGPVTPAHLAEALEVSSTLVEAALKQLESALAGRGVRLQRSGGRVQLTSAPQLAATIERFLGLEATSHLGRGALETLAIIAYQQPVTRPQIDAVRGVNSDSMLKGLLGKSLILESGRAEGPGRPILYSTSPEFLQHFGLNSITDLPPLEPGERGVENHDGMLKG